MPPWILLVTSYYRFPELCRVNILCRAKGPTTAYMRFFLGGGIAYRECFPTGGHRRRFVTESKVTAVPRLNKAIESTAVLSLARPLARSLALRPPRDLLLPA